MPKPLKRFKDVLLKPVVADITHSRTLRFSLFLLVLATIPLTQLLAGQPQDIRQRARETTPITPSPQICQVGLRRFSFEQACNETGAGGFRYANFLCYNGFSGKLGDGLSCKTPQEWRALASEACMRNSSCQPTRIVPALRISPTNPRLTPIPTPR